MTYFPCIDSTDFWPESVFPGNFKSPIVFLAFGHLSNAPIAKLGSRPLILLESILGLGNQIYTILWEVVAVPFNEDQAALLQKCWASILISVFGFKPASLFTNIVKLEPPGETLCRFGHVGYRFGIGFYGI